ncbi:prolyl aminopeptidase [Candidatus Thiodiazotropha sp. CDECU1]|uniref:prolyl aminopeptidase n=1 Tax=Candidatus Thiodiazotropha sp. CDECU1 TaxID=3065865 RepID=UPI00292EB3F7|nr:prolyl aminopeptidase [Candidatus Thiodiazotropha sp. CDECU1]
MRSLYPSIEPYAVHHIDVENPHVIYVEECGNPSGIPVVCLHGGPGSGCSVEHRRFFDSGFYRIILFDQRGSGRSQPLGETAGNRTLDLISDMEVIRHRLDIPQWMLFGGSWGATLSLLYAQSHPESVLGMILRGTFLARASDLDWFFVGLKRLFPQAWERLSKEIPDCEHARDIIDWYYSALQGEDPAISLGAACNWSGWGTLMVNWHKSGSGNHLEEKPATDAQRERLLAKVGIETHYAHHRYFIEDNEILSRIGSLPAMPVTLVHGRYDLTCTMESAWLLHKAIPDSRLVQVPDAGHLIDEPAMISALVGETDRMRELLQEKSS